MQRFEYLVRGDFDEQAENAARACGSRESDRLKAYSASINSELNRLGAEGWELIQAPDQTSNHNWVFKRQVLA
jgi:hypothetical protein